MLSYEYNSRAGLIFTAIKFCWKKITLEHDFLLFIFLESEDYIRHRRDKFRKSPRGLLSSKKLFDRQIEALSVFHFCGCYLQFVSYRLINPYCISTEVQDIYFFSRSGYLYVKCMQYFAFGLVKLLCC